MHVLGPSGSVNDFGGGTPACIGPSGMVVSLYPSRVVPCKKKASWEVGALRQVLDYAKLGCRGWPRQTPKHVVMFCQFTLQNVQGCLQKQRYLVAYIRHRRRRVYERCIGQVDYQ